MCLMGVKGLCLLFLLILTVTPMLMLHLSHLHTTTDPKKLERTIITIDLDDDPTHTPTTTHHLNQTTDNHQKQQHTHVQVHEDEDEDGEHTTSLNLRHNTAPPTTPAPTDNCQPPTVSFTNLMRKRITTQLEWIATSKHHVCRSSASQCDCSWASKTLCKKKPDKSICNAICCCEVMIDSTIYNELTSKTQNKCISHLAKDSRALITSLLSQTQSIQAGCNCDWVQYEHCHPSLNDGSPCWTACCMTLHKQQFLLRVEQVLIEKIKETATNIKMSKFNAFEVGRIAFPITEATPPWQNLKDQQKEQFYFQNVDDLLPNHFGSTHTRMPLKQTLCREGLLNVLCTKTNVLKCVSCLLSWYVIVSKDGKYSHNVWSKIDEDSSQVVLYESTSSLVDSSSANVAKIDVGIPWGCSLKKLKTFLKHFPDDINHDTRLLVTNFKICGQDKKGHVVKGPTNKEVSALIRLYANKKLKRYKVIHIPGSFQRAIGCNVLHDEARDDSILTVLDVDMRIQTRYFQRSLIFASQGKSIYFPIVWSTFDPHNVKRVAKFRGDDYKYLLNVVGSTHGGKWRKWGAGNYAVSGTDAKLIKLDENFKGWGGEDTDFLSRAGKQLHVVRANDPHIVHRWHKKDCSQSTASKKISCMQSLAEYEGSALSLVLKEEQVKEKKKLPVGK